MSFHFCCNQEVRDLHTPILIPRHLVKYFLELSRQLSFDTEPLTLVTGGGLMAQTNTQKTGKNVVVFGLFLQIVFFGFFLVTGGLFHYRINRSPTPFSATISWQKYMYSLYAAGLLILVRSIFRMAEFTGSVDGPIMTHEYFLYIFDAVLMLGVMIMFNVLHPGALLGRGANQSPPPVIDLEGDYTTSSEQIPLERKRGFRGGS